MYDVGVAGIHRLIPELQKLRARNPGAIVVAAGGMILGCALDLGADRGAIKELIEASVPVSVDAKEVLKNGIKALDVRIKVPDKEQARTYPVLVDIIKGTKLPTKVEEIALENLHFHEVGQNDALADVIGSSAAIHALNCDSIFCMPINVSSGTIQCAHGVLPVPAPATLEIIKGLSNKTRWISLFHYYTMDIEVYRKLKKSFPVNKTALESLANEVNGITK